LDNIFIAAVIKLVFDWLVVVVVLQRGFPLASGNRPIETYLVIMRIKWFNSHTSCLNISHGLHVIEERCVNVYEAGYSGENPQNLFD